MVIFGGGGDVRVESRYSSCFRKEAEPMIIFGGG